MTKEIGVFAVSFPEFKLSEIINPDEANANNADISDKLNELINQSNVLSADGYVGTDQLADGSVVDVKLGDGAIIEAKIANGAVTSFKLADGSVTSSKIADNAVTTDKVSDDSITSAKLSGDIGVDKVNKDSFDSRYPTNDILATLLSAKTDIVGNHEGTWHGLTPSQIEGGQQAFDIEVLRNAINEQSVELSTHKINEDAHGLKNWVQSFGIGGNSVTAPNNNLNDIVVTGNYIISQTANAPFGYGTVYHTTRNAEATQIAIETGDPANRVLVRRKVGATWFPWKRILNSDDYDTLFQFANDGKTNVANAVTAKGISASPADTFSQLASKIGQISTGKKSAIGTTTSSTGVFSGFSNTGGGGLSSYELVVSGLDFKPSLIVSVFHTGLAQDTIYLNVAFSEPIVVASYSVQVIGTRFVLSGSSHSHTDSLANLGTRGYINNGGFRIPVTYPNVPFKWYAFE